MNVKKTIKTVLFAAFALAILPVISYATGTTGATFLNVGVSARSEAMGGAYSAIADDASAVTINPAGMVQVKKSQVSVMHNESLLDINQEYFSYVTNWGNKAFGTNLIYVDYGTQMFKDENDAGTSTFKPKSYALSFAYSAYASKVLSYGVAIKYVKMDIGVDNYEDSTFAVDLGLLYKPHPKGWRMGAVLSHLGGGLTLYKEEDPLPLTFKIATAYEWDNIPLLASFDWYMIKEENPEYHFGAQYTISDIVPVRLGYSSQSDLDNGFSYGIGLVQDQFALDYAFIPAGEMDDTHRFSLLFNF